MTVGHDAFIAIPNGIAKRAYNDHGIEFPEVFTCETHTERVHVSLSPPTGRIVCATEIQV